MARQRTSAICCRVFPLPITMGLNITDSCPRRRRRSSQSSSRTAQSGLSLPQENEEYHSAIFYPPAIFWSRRMLCKRVPTQRLVAKISPSRHHDEAPASRLGTFVSLFRPRPRLPLPQQSCKPLAHCCLRLLPRVLRKNLWLCPLHQRARELLRGATTVFSARQSPR